MKYRAAIDLGNQNTSHSLLAHAVIDHIASGGRVLDVGCAAGDLGAALTERGYTVVGIEGDAERAEMASRRLARVAMANLDRDDLPSILDGEEPFDAIIFGDVLEHLYDPAHVLARVKNLLNSSGKVLASIPNVAHGSVRLALLQGRWAYTDEGLLDRTHIRFFTMSSVQTLFDEAGLVIDKLSATVADPLATEIEIDEQSLPNDVVEWVRDEDGAFDYQYIVQAHWAADDGAADSDFSGTVHRPDPLPRLVDVHTSFHEDAGHGNKQGPATRNYAIRLEAELDEARNVIRQRDDDLHQVRTELIETHVHLAAAIADGQAAHRRLHDALVALEEERRSKADPNASLPRRVFSRVAEKLRKAKL